MLAELFQVLLLWLRDPALVSLVATSLAITLLVWSWHRDPKSSVDLRFLIVDTKSEKVDLYKVGYMTVLVYGVWTQITMVLRNQFSTEYALGLLGIFAVGRVASTGINSWKATKTGEPGAPSN